MRITNKISMKILQIITPSRISGAEKYLIYLSRELIKLGHELIIIIEKGQKLIEYINAEFTVVPVKIGGKANIFGYRRLKKHVELIKPSIIHTHLTTASWFAGWIGKRLKIPVVSTVHAINSKNSYINATKIIAVSQAVYDDLIVQGVSEKQVELALNGIPYQKGNCKISKAELMDQLGIPLDHQIIGIVAHFSKKKGHKYLLKAFSQINNKKLTIVLCGEGKLEKKLKKLCVKLNINQRVIFVGFQKDIYNMYKLFNILILPSIKGEGLPLSVLEAMSMGIPVIASSISGLKEIIDDGINGYLVPPKNIEYLKDKINYLINDKSLQNTFGTNGKYKITSQFTIQNNALRILQIYNKILSVYIKINV